MSEFLDELARTMAKPMPRRRALRILGGALVTLAVPATSGTAAASVGRQQVCECNTAGTTACGIPLLAGCTLQCCDKVNSICFKWPGYGGPIPRGGAGGSCSAHQGVPGKEPPRVVCCCPRNTRKGNLAGGEPPCVPICRTKLCGPSKKCCPADEECVQFQLSAGGRTHEQCAPKCEPGTRRCNLSLNCCPTTQNCCTLRPGEKGVCCGPEQVCVRASNTQNESVRLCVRKCKPPEVRCNFVCCNPDQRAYRKLKDGRIRCHCVRD